MNTAKQFWALLRFLVGTNPFLLFMPLIFATPILIPLMTSSIKSYHPSLDVALMGNTNLFFVGFIGVNLLLPELFQFNGSAMATWVSGTEFVLTRAVDRHIVYRSRSFYYYALVLAIPCILILHACGQPALQLNEYSHARHTEILLGFPNAIAAPTDKNGHTEEITIPYGSVLISAWYLGIFLIVAILTQVLIFLIGRLKFRRFIFWTTYIGLVFLPFFAIFSHNHDRLTISESLFIDFANHQIAFWAALLGAAILGQVWFERSFARMEL